jgi:hypothetical protein
MKRARDKVFVLFTTAEKEQAHKVLEEKKWRLQA